MNDKQIEIFLTAAECGSFSKSEKQMYLSRQAIMKQIDRLEAEMGVQLFVRTPTGLTLTDVGIIFRDGLIPVRRQMQELLSACRRADELPTQLRIEIPRHPVSILDEVIAIFSRRYPDIKLDVVRATSKGRIERIRSGQIDVADIPYRSDYDLTGLTYTHLADYPYYCLFIPSHPLAKKTQISPHDLGGIPIYVHNPFFRRLLTERVSSSQLNITEISGDEMDAILSVCYGGGVYITPAHFATRVSQLTAVPLESAVVQKIGLLSRDEPNRAVEKFIEIAMELLLAGDNP